ncbi:MAG: MmcQ/YjbR family DNA-binding protein [Rhizomicrobium sp.]
MPSPRIKTPPKYAAIKKAALALPSTREIQDGHGIWFNIGSKTFALFGSRSERWTLRLPKDRVTMLVEAAPDTFAPMRAGALLWLYVDVTKLGPKELRAYVEAAWRYTAPKKLQARLTAE